MRAWFFIIFSALFTTTLFAKEQSNTKQLQQSKMLDAIVKQEVKHRARMRLLERQLEEAQLKSAIAKLKQGEQKDFDIGIAGQITSQPTSAILGDKSHDAVDAINPRQNETPQIIGFRNQKGIFKVGDALIELGAGQMLPNKMRVVKVDADGAKLRTKHGYIYQKITWQPQRTGG